MKTAIFIDKRNAEQVKWWNKLVVRKLVRFRWIDTVIDSVTGEVIGYVFVIKGFLKHFIARKNIKFISNPTTIIASYKN